MMRIAASLLLALALVTVGCNDEPKPHLPDFDPERSIVDPAGGVPPGSVGGAGTAGGGSDAGRADAGSADVSQDPDTVPDSGDQ